MPALRVENAKSSRSRCALKACAAFIQKGELRIGTGVLMPGMEELSFKWRHLCCFTARQIKNMGGSVDNVDGYDDLTPPEQELVRQMLSGKLVGDKSIVGRGATEAASAAPAAKVAAGRVNTERPSKRQREKTLHVVEDVSDATEEYDTEVVLQDARPPLCPYGAACFRKNPEHYKQYAHGDEPHIGESVEKQLLVIAKKKPAAVTVAPAPVPVVPAARALSPPRPTGSGTKPICAHGALCFRKDPKHFAEFDHS
jgi:hypothetical protein